MDHGIPPQSAFQPLRVVHVIPSMDDSTGGPAVATRGLVRALSARGVECTVLTTDAAGPAHWRSRTTQPHGRPTEPVPVLRVPIRQPHRLLRAPGFREALEGLLDSADLVHAHGQYLLPHLATSRACRRRGVPYIVAPRGTIDPYMLRRHRWRKRLWGLAGGDGYLKDAAALVLTSERERLHAERLFPRQRTYVVPNGVSPLPESCASVPEPVSTATGPVIMNVGRLSSKKQLDLLVQALPLVTDAHPDARLVLVGPDDEGIGQHLSRIAERLGVLDHLLLTGFVPWAELRPFYEAADVWVLPSASENFGNVVFEALASATPVVISDALDLSPDLASAGAVVEIPRPITPSAIAEAVIRVLRDPDLRQRLTETGPAFVERYSWPRVAAEMEAVYRNVLAETSLDRR